MTKTQPPPRQVGETDSRNTHFPPLHPTDPSTPRPPSPQRSNAHLPPRQSYPTSQLTLSAARTPANLRPASSASSRRRADSALARRTATLTDSMLVSGRSTATLFPGWALTAAATAKSRASAAANAIRIRAARAPRPPVGAGCWLRGGASSLVRRSCGAMRRPAAGSFGVSVPAPAESVRSLGDAAVFGSRSAGELLCPVGCKRPRRAAASLGREAPSHVSHRAPVQVPVSSNSARPRRPAARLLAWLAWPEVQGSTCRHVAPLRRDAHVALRAAQARLAERSAQHPRREGPSSESPTSARANGWGMGRGCSRSEGRWHDLGAKAGRRSPWAAAAPPRAPSCTCCAKHPTSCPGPPVPGRCDPASASALVAAPVLLVSAVALTSGPSAPPPAPMSWPRLAWGAHDWGESTAVCVAACRPPGCSTAWFEGPVPRGFRDLSLCA